MARTPRGRQRLFRYWHETGKELTGPVAVLEDTGTTPSSNGEFRRDGTDVKVYTGGAAKNLSNIGSGGGGGGYGSLTTVTSDYTASDGEIVLADASGGAVTVTLPSPSEALLTTVKKIDSSTNTVTVATPSTETIDGASSESLSSQWEAIESTSDGVDYFII